MTSDTSAGFMYCSFPKCDNRTDMGHNLVCNECALRLLGITIRGEES